jgi:hypothetical protein
MCNKTAYMYYIVIVYCIYLEVWVYHKSSYDDEGLKRFADNSAYPTHRDPSRRDQSRRCTKTKVIATQLVATQVIALKKFL